MNKKITKILGGVLACTIALTSIIKHIACIKLVLIILGINIPIKISLVTCSKKLDNIYGNIFWRPQKYPFIIDETLINGASTDIHIIGKYRLLLWSKFVDNVLANIIVISIIKAFIMKDRGNSDNIIVFDLSLLLDITFDILVG